MGESCQTKLIRLESKERYQRLIDRDSGSSGIKCGHVILEPGENIGGHTTGLFVLPSYYEGLPIVLLEAMSYGLLCLASDIPANRCISLPDKNYFTKIPPDRDTEAEV